MNLIIKQHISVVNCGLNNNMNELISLNNIQIDVEAKDWEDAIRKAGKLLEDNKSISNLYIENMITSVKTLGPYIVLMPGFALGHAEPSEEVYKNDLSLITLKQPVNFGSNNDPVKVVMCMACTDKQSHIEKIQAIAYKLMADDAIENMLKCQTSEQLYEYINN